MKRNAKTLTSFLILYAIGFLILASLMLLAADSEDNTTFFLTKVAGISLGIISYIIIKKIQIQL